MGTPCKIRITKELNGVFQQYQPTVGTVYDATYYPPMLHANSIRHKACAECVALDIAGKKIIVRPGEYEMIEGGVNG